MLPTVTWLMKAKFLANNFVVGKFLHIRCQGNYVAHNIARPARHVSEFTVWMDDVPPHLHNVVLTNAAIFIE